MIKYINAYAWICVLRQLNCVTTFEFNVIHGCLSIRYLCYCYILQWITFTSLYVLLMHSLALLLTLVNVLLTSATQYYIKAIWRQ